MAFSDDLLAGVAAYLVPAGFTWRTDGMYAATDPWPLFSASMPGTPDRAVVLALYGGSNHVSLSDSTVRLQARIRGTTDPRTVNAAADAIVDRLTGAHGVNLSTGVRLVLAEYLSGAPVGTDGNGRHQRTENFDLSVWRPSQHRD